MSFILHFLLLSIISLSCATDLIECPRGKYLSLQNDTCIDCPPGTFFPTTGALQVRSCQPCFEDTFSTGGAFKCEKCPQGQISFPGSSSCIECPAGTRLRTPFVPKPSCDPCINGYTTKKNQRVCTLCPAGFIAPRGATSKDQCTRCPPGTQPEHNSPRCRGCFARKIQDGKKTTLCQDCPIGSIRNNAATECLPCRPGQRGERIDDRRGFSFICSDCPNGTTTVGSGNDFCKTPEESCPAERLTTTLGDCLSCSTDHFLVPGNPERCQRCPIGQGSAGGLVRKCLPCEEIVRRNIKDSRCISDPQFDNSLTGPLVFGIRARDQNGDCPLGTIVNVRFPYSCIACGRSTTTTKKNARECEKCPINFTTNTNGQPNCVPCPKGFIRFGGSTCVELTSGCFPDTVLIRDQNIRDTTVPFCENLTPFFPN